MAAIDSAERHAGTERHSDDGAKRPFALLRTVFIVAPVAFGFDKLADLLTGWEQNLAPWINSILPGDAYQAIAAGVVELVAGLAVTVVPHVLLGDRAPAFIDPVVDLANEALTWLLS